MLLLLLLLLLELMLFIDVFRNLKLFADVVERDRRYLLVVVVTVGLGRRRCGVCSHVSVAIGNDDASSRSRRRHVVRYGSSQLVDDVRVRLVKY